jgi:hypothetical protein
MAIVTLYRKNGDQACRTDNAAGWFGSVGFGPVGSDGRCEIVRPLSENMPAHAQLWITEGDKP